MDSNISVPSKQSFQDWADDKPFRFYAPDSCHDDNDQFFVGECHGLTLGSGLLVITNSEQTNPLTKINIKTTEIPTNVNFPQETTTSDLIIDEKNVEETNAIVCGKGTVLKGNECVLDSISKTNDEKQIRGGGCLIATASYGTELSNQVQFLREIRDDKILQTDSGSVFLQYFNEFYYSFSPYVADYQRQNPIFNEIVKIGITPMLSALSIMSFADTASEILGYGIGVIFMNLGMYIVAPAFLLVKIFKK